MIREHSTIEELTALDALGGLDPEDRERLTRERAAHGVCVECERLQVGFAETAGRLALALDPLPAGEVTADRILRIARSLDRSAAASEGGRPPRRALPRVLVAAAAAFLLVVGAVLLRDVTRSTEVTVAFAGSSTAQLRVTFAPGNRDMRLRGSGFRRLSGGRVYELWTFRGTTPYRTVCFPAAGGSVSLTARAPMVPRGTMAVTVEPACANAPTTQPILEADLSKVTQQRA